MMMMMRGLPFQAFGLALLFPLAQAWIAPRPSTLVDGDFSLASSGMDRRGYLSTMLGTVSAGLLIPQVNAAPVQDSLDIDNFIRTGVDLGGNMGVSRRAGL